MRSVHIVHIILAMHVSSGLAHFLRLKSVSVSSFEINEDIGCRSTSVRVSYQCGELNDTQAELPKLFSFRVDCRGAKGDFQNLTLFDSGPSCGHLTYRKYGNSSVRNLISRLPFISDHVVTIQKGEVLDFQCVLRSLNIFRRERQNSSLGRRDLEDLEEALFSPKFDLIQDGVKRLLYWPIEVELLYLIKDQGPCIQSLAKAYEWTMRVAMSKGLTYWVSYGSPVLQPQILPPMVQFSSELRGDISVLDKDILRLKVVEVTSYNSWKQPQDTLRKLVQLDDDFYGDATESYHSFSVDFKLRVNPDLLRSDTKEVVVILGVVWPHSQQATYFDVTLPIFREKSSWWPWLTLAFLLIFLAAMAYVFREQLFMFQAFQLLWRRSAGLPDDETGVAIEMRS